MPDRERRLTTIVAIDVAGYSRLMHADETGTLDRLKQARAITDPIGREHGGRIVGTWGDGLLLEFPSVVEAVSAALRVQDAMATFNANTPDDEQLLYRIGINLGDVIVEGGNLFGDGVNVAARLEALAEPGGICVSQATLYQVRDKIELTEDDLSDVTVKNIQRPVHVYRISARSETIAGLAKDTPLSDTGEPLSIPSSFGDKPALVVLPFENMSSDPEQDYFVNGITEDLTAALSRYHEFFVIAPNSAFAYKSRPVDIKQIHHELGVGFVIEGSVRRSGGRVRISAQLIEAPSGNHLWADRFDRDLRDLFALQDEITQLVAGRCGGLFLGLVSSQALQLNQVKLGAYDLALQARALMGTTGRGRREDYEAAVELCRRSILLNPVQAEAYTALAWCEFWAAHNHWSDNPITTLKHARELAVKAIAISPEDSLAYNRLGGIETHLGNLDQAIIAQKKAIALNPSRSTGYVGLAAALNYVGRPDEALAAAQFGKRLNPRDRSPIVSAILARSLIMLKRFSEAFDECEKATALDPQYVSLQALAAAACAGQNRIDLAKRYIERIIEIAPNFTLTNLPSAWPHKVPADIEEMIVLLRKAGLPE